MCNYSLHLKLDIGVNEMVEEITIKLFQDQSIRAKWDSEIEDYYYSIIDVIGILTESKNPRKYWSVLKSRMKKEGAELATICSQLKLPSPKDGKLYNTDGQTPNNCYV